MLRGHETKLARADRARIRLLPSQAFASSGRVEQLDAVHPGRRKSVCEMGRGPAPEPFEADARTFWSFLQEGEFPMTNSFERVLADFEGTDSGLCRGWNIDACGP